MGSRFRQSKSCGARYAAGSEDEHSAPGKSQLFLQGAQNPHVVGIAAEERTISPDHDGVDGANLGGKRVAFLQVPPDGLFVRNRNAEAADAELRDGPEKIA